MQSEFKTVSFLLSVVLNPRYLFALRTPEDTTRLQQALSRAKKAVILGASFIGIKLAEIVMERGIEVTLVDVVDQVLPQVAHPDCAALLMKHIEQIGLWGNACS